MSELGTASRTPLAVAFNVMADELDGILDRICRNDSVIGIVPTENYWWVVDLANGGLVMVKRDTVEDAFRWAKTYVERTPGAAFDSWNLAQTWGALHSFGVESVLGGEGAVGQAAVSGSAATNGEPERAPSPPSTGLVGEPPSLAGRDNPAAVLGNETVHSGGSPTRHLNAVPEEAA